MPLEKQSLNNFLPDGFETLNQEGYKTNFSEDKIKTGYEKDIKDRVSGPNLNNLIDVIGKNTNTLNNYVEYLNNMPVNNIPIINSNNQLDYFNKNDLDGANKDLSNLTTSGQAKFDAKADNSELDKKVNKSGDTMTGNLNINKNGGIVSITGTGYKGFTTKSTDIDYTLTNQVSLQGARIMSTDKNGQWFGYFQNGIGSGGNIFTGISARRMIDGAAKECAISCNVNNTGGIYTSAPTPAAYDNSTKIATTAWVQTNNAFPSSRYTNLTLGASGTQYTAPANGWVSISMQGSGNAYTLNIDAMDVYGYNQTGTFNGFSLTQTIPVRKGQKYEVKYTNMTKNYFRFIYAEGVK